MRIIFLKLLWCTFIIKTFVLVNLVCLGAMSDTPGITSLSAIITSINKEVITEIMVCWENLLYFQQLFLTEKHFNQQKIYSKGWIHFCHFCTSFNHQNLASPGNYSFDCSNCYLRWCRYPKTFLLSRWVIKQTCSMA